MINTVGTKGSGFFRLYKTCLLKELRGLFKSRQSIWVFVALFVPYLSLVPSGSTPALIPIPVEVPVIWFSVGLLGCIQYVWDSTTKDRSQKISVLYFNLGISPWYPLSSKLTVCLLYLLIYVPLGLPMTLSYLSGTLLFNGFLFVIYGAVLEYSFVMMVRDSCSVLFIFYAPSIILLGTLLVFWVLPWAVLRIAFILILTIIIYLCFVKTMNSKRYRCNM